MPHNRAQFTVNFARASNVRQYLSLGVAAIFFAAAPIAQTQIKPTFASTSLCGDSYVLALAPDQVRALSWQSRTALSLATEAQRQLPQVWNDPESLLGIKNDIIIFGPGEGKFKDRLSTPSFVLSWGEDFDAVFENLARIEARLGQETSVTAQLRARLAQVKASAEQRARMNAPRPRILYLSRSGGTAGAGTFVDAAIKAAGGLNIAPHAGWSTPEPETLLALTPDLILTSYFESGYESVQASAVRHAAVRKFVDSKPAVNIPGALWPCAGPGLVTAAEQISKAIEGLNAQDGTPS